MDEYGRVAVRCRQCVDERDGVDKAVRCYCPDTPCRRPSRVQDRSVAVLRSGKAHQAAQRLLCGCVCLAYGRGTRFPYQYAKCRKGTQYPAQKAVLAKRKTNAVAFVRQQYSV
jgi:hypothetical protein